MNALCDAAFAASLFAVDPFGMGGVCIRSRVHPARDQWLRLLRDLMPAGDPMRRIPFSIADGRLLGGLDLVATIKANRPVAERGVLAATDGGVLVVAMAERLTAHTAACLAAALDAGEVILPREGVFVRSQARVGIVAIDEGISEDESVPLALLDRFAFLLDFDGFAMRSHLKPMHDTQQIAAARRLLTHGQFDAQIATAICATALALGAGSPRVSMLALRAARAAAALDGRLHLREQDAVLAARLVLAPRATTVPMLRQDESPENPSESDSDSPVDRPEESNSGELPQSLAELELRDIDDLVLAASRAAIPNGLLTRLQNAGAGRVRRPSAVGRAGVLGNARMRGRPCGVRQGAPTGGARLNVIETLRAAAPWQGLRGRSADGDSRVLIAPGDFRVTRYRQRSQTLTIFVVDASGSSALHRLAEAKGSVELLLADCYIRRDQVALIAFRGRGAEVLLPPTRSLVRAKRSLSELPGGGGTPLAAAVEAAMALAVQVQRRGVTPTIVMLTDGRANVTRDGTGGREAAQAEALRAAAALGASKITALLIDTSLRPSAFARQLAQMMRADYIPLPLADSRALSNVVKATAAAAS
jgi:magnesium chelatase subunit D